MTFNFLPKENLQYFLNQIKNKLDLKVDKVSGKTLSTNDLTNSLKTSYDDAVSKKHTHANKAVLDNTTASFTTEEKTKLSGIENNAQKNTVIGVKGEVETDYRVGNVNITKENIGLENVANERQWSETNHPTTISGYGITDSASSTDYNTLKGRVDTNEDNIAMLDSDVESLTTDVGMLETDMTTVKSAVTTIQDDYVPKTRKVNGKSLSADITLSASDVKAIPISQKGTSNGVAELDGNGLVPSSQLPSYVDDVLEYDTKTDFPTNGESGKIYIATDTNLQYRWTGTQYAEISSSLALGETSSTAYRGDRGKIAYDHSQKASGNPHNVTKSDVGLGNVGNFKAVSTVASQGLTDAEKANARANIGAGTGSSNFSGAYADLSGRPTLGTAAAKNVPASGNASTSEVVLGSDTRLSNARPASDVSAWAKASSKPSYTWDEITNKPTSFSPYFANSTWYLVGDDVYIGDHDQAGGLGIWGVNSNTKLDFCQYDNNSNFKSITFDGTTLYLDGNCCYASQAGNADTLDGNHASAFATSSHTHSYADLSGRPTLGTAASKNVPASGNASTSEVVLGNDTRLTDARKASDVYSWAKASVKPSYTKSEIGLGSVDNTTDVNKPVSTAQQKAIDAAYANSNKYTDKKIADLINGAPETMDTLKEVSDAINASKSVEEALNKAIGTKANQTELDTHTGNDTIHITATERTNWNDANSKKHSHANKTTLDGITADKVASWDKISNKIDTDGNASNTTVAFKEATTRTNLTTGEKISISFGKIAKWFNDLKTVAFSGNYNDLTNKPTIPSVGNGTVTITQNGASKGTFTMNQSGNTTIALTDTNTNTWRDVVDNLSSTRTDASLSANQGRILGAKLPFALGIDADGNYGYYKAGADTVTPFKTGDKIINSRFPNGKSLVGLDSFVLTSNGKTYEQGSNITISENTTKIGDNKVPNGSIRIYNKSGGASGMAFTPDYIDLTDINFIFTSSVYAGSSSHTGFRMYLTIVDENGNGIELASTGFGFSNTIKQGNLCANVYGYSGKYRIGYRAAFPESGYVDIFYFGLS